MALGKRLLLLSSSKKFGSGEWLEYARKFVVDFFAKSNVKKILFVPYASRDYDKYASMVKEGFKPMDLAVESIHEKADSVKAIEEAEGIFIGGGNTFLLLKTLYDRGLIEPIRKRVLQDFVPYMGISAGTNVATISICTTNDMPICYPPTLDALQLVKFNINPHYVDPDSSSTHMGETREERIREYLENDDVPPVLGLKEGSILLVEDKKATLIGISEAKLFEKNKNAVTYAPGDDMSFLPIS